MISSISNKINKTVYPIINSSRLYSSAAAHGHESVAGFPSVKRLLKEYGIDFNSVKGSGPHGRLIKGDILDYISQKNLKPIDLFALSTPKLQQSQQQQQQQQAPSQQQAQQINNKRTTTPKFEDFPHNNIRKVIATKLSQSKQTVPHLYMTVQCVVDNMLTLRSELISKGLKYSVNDFIMKACALALRDNPQANSKWDEKSQSIITNPTVDISFAVSTDRGLITPIIKSIDQKSVGDIAKEGKDLAGLARDGKLKPEQFIGGTFSVSNLGMFGITHFNAIINYPQAGILAIGTGRKVILNNNTNNNNNTNTSNLDQDDLLFLHSQNNAPKVSNIIDVTLSGDNRVFDDDVAAKFLDSFQKYLSNPNSMLL
eukprot:gene4578-5715_t